MRSKGSGALFRVPADERLPLKYWQVCVELPRVDGVRRRQVARSKDYGTALDKLERLRRHSRLTGKRPSITALADQPELLESDSVGNWLRYWLSGIATLTIKPKTAASYRSIVERHLVPALGSRSLAGLAASDVRELHNVLRSAGIGQPTILQAHRVLSVALTQAEREGYVRRNVARLTPTPRKAKPALGSWTRDEMLLVLNHCKSYPFGSRWAAALLTGARQGELLGLEIDRVTDTLDLSWQLQRLTWQHGCGGRCGWPRGCDCPGRTLNAPFDFEARHLAGGLWLTRPKTNAGFRAVPLIEPLRSSLLSHIDARRAEPNPFGLVWKSLNGRPLDPRADNRAWGQLLRSAGVPAIRLHDARHAMVDLLYDAGVPEAAISDIVGHSTTEMSRAYRSRSDQQRLAGHLASAYAHILPTSEPNSLDP